MSDGGRMLRRAYWDTRRARGQCCATGCRRTPERKQQRKLAARAAAPRDAMVLKLNGRMVGGIVGIG